MIASAGSATIVGVALHDGRRFMYSKSEEWFSKPAVQKLELIKAHVSLLSAMWPCAVAMLGFGEQQVEERYQLVNEPPSSAITASLVRIVEFNP
mmetsp:Transcript_11064/g.28549  ORF Transcript_11064/g.28549 Transcript_11064/m.28549 type:complete len:94 (-) Transcript_11064:313-594(-)